MGDTITSLTDIRCKIVITVGPACLPHLEQLMKAGASIFRVNAAHVDSESGPEMIGAVRQAAASCNQKIAIMLDLAGPKIRVGQIDPEPVRLSPGDEAILVPNETCHEGEIPVHYDDLARDLTKGQRILLADGSIELNVEKVDPPHVHVRIVHGGLLLSRKGVNFPDIPTNLPTLAPKDMEALKWGLDENVDIISLSFVRSPMDIHELRGVMKAMGKTRPIVAKLEKPQALEKLEEILDVTDAVMVARGDLGIEVPYDEIGTHQKTIIRKAVERAKPVITATQLLLTMVENPYPTRAEVTDITNAVLDGTDCLMLSDETAGGKHPKRAVKVLHKVIRTAEKYAHDKDVLSPFRESISLASLQHAVCYAAYGLTQRIDFKAILVPTWSGSSARIISSYRPQQPILAFTPQERTYQILALSRSVHPFLIEPVNDPTELTNLIVEMALERTSLEQGDRVLIAAGLPFSKGEKTNWLQVEEL